MLTGVTNHALERLPDFMNVIATGSEDDFEEAIVPDGVQERLTNSVLKQCRK